MANETKRVRCAIYTRKSSEEGLEQSFNSLEAQREACEAFITSQRHEGWRALATGYNDGGYSGGSIERPALKQLLLDIEAGKVDTVVVYKVDRLTRALSDFAKIIETFDSRQVSFVSVTQQFNTTTSMGRLTLNVLLSFAQFEREVTGERIRDKIAASKRKGMWMGGKVPPGYALKGRRLVVNEPEAERVREIYRQYLKHGCVSKLKAHLDENGQLTERRTSRNGKVQGGTPYARGALYRILQNRLHIGEIAHRDQAFAGQHEGIVPRDLWDAVQKQLRENDHAHRTGSRARESSLFVGLVYDDDGNRFTPSHTVKKGKRYRYYVSCIAEENSDKKSPPSVGIPAGELEGVVRSSIRSLLASPERLSKALKLKADNPKLKGKLEKLPFESQLASREPLKSLIAKIVLHQESLDLLIRRSILRKLIGLVPSRGSGESLFALTVPFQLARANNQTHLIVPEPADAPARPSPPMIKAIVRAHDWLDGLIGGDYSSKRAIARQIGVTERYVSRILECAFLAPDITEAILEGRQPRTLVLNHLIGLPPDWAVQRQRLGFAPRQSLTSSSPTSS